MKKQNHCEKDGEVMKKIGGWLVVSMIGLVMSSCTKTKQCSLPASVKNASDQSQIVATVDGQAITEDEFFSKLTGPAKGEYIKARSQYFDAKTQALREYIFQNLVEKEAAKQGKSKEDILKQEIDQKMNKVSDKAALDFYNQVKAQFAMRGQTPPPFDSVKPQIVQRLEMEGQFERKEAYYAELQKKYNVNILVDQPRVNVSVGDNPVRGSEDAPITIVEFSDYHCPFCEKGANTMKQVMEEYKGKVSHHFRDFPLSIHPRAKFAANAARCAGEQGKYWEYHDKAFANQDKKEDADFVAFAKELKLDEKKFQECVSTTKYFDKIDKDMQDGESVGVNGTPAYIVNGVLLSGAVPFERFKEVIDSELKNKPVM
ncbi:MAG: thioredoxin domain-containing protein [Bdellovibrionota bacterium]